MRCKSTYAVGGLMGTVVVGLLAAPSLFAQTSEIVPRVDADSGASVRAYTLEAPEGESYFALALRAESLTGPPSAARDHVVLIDTSASQVGAHRERALAILNQFLQSLPDGARTALVAVDVKSQALTEGFVAPRGEAVGTALSKLQDRAPLGATKLRPALQDALQMVEDDRPASIVYIGDGMSTADGIRAEEIEPLLQKLREERVPVHSYAVGPKTDLQLLGVLGQQTGGVVLFDRPQEDEEAEAAAMGRRMAAAADAPVFYPEDIQVPETVAELLPEAPLPIRSDRETVYLGRGTLAAEAQIEVSGRFGDDELSLSWTLRPEQIVERKNAFLKPLWQRARQSDGVMIGLAGLDLLQVARADFERYVDRLSNAGEEAVVRNDVEQVRRIARSIRQIDPENARAESLLKATDRSGEQRAVAQVQNQNQDQAPPPEADQPQGQPSPPPEAPDLLEEQTQILEAREQQLTLDVSRAIERAREVLEQNPSGAIAQLKRTLSTVEAAPDISPDVRQQLRQRLQEEIQRATNRREQLELRRIQRQQSLAQAEAERRLVEEMVLRQEELQNLISQVRSLLEEAEHGNDESYEAAESVARAAVNLEPGEGTAAAALFSSEAAGQLNQAFRLRSLRADRFLETLHQVELSHVPFPDEPPVRFPPEAVWRELTQRRSKWASVSLETVSPAEERIRAALDETTNLEFFDTPLTEVIGYIEDVHGITVLFDQASLQEFGISTDTPVTVELSQISLRSALKIILQDIVGDLSYVIEDEVMKITTTEEAQQRLQTRVYPVGDLVVPISSGMGGGLGGGMMGGGMMGGGMGGMGGGMGGMGGMGGGGMGGMGGGGGGFFSVPPADLPDSTAPHTDSLRKKKPLR